MTRHRTGRFATLLTTAAMALALLGVGTVSAAQPNWNVSFDRLPNVVAPGNDAGWFVTVTNEGPSNINDLNITITAPDSIAAGLGSDFTLPSYFSGMTLSSGGTATCSTATGAQVCNVGTLADDGWVTFTVAFAVPATQTGAFDVAIGLVAGTGDTPSDGPGKSRGDKSTFADATPVSQSSNFDGGFVVGDFLYETNQSIGRRNLQATSLESPVDLIGVTIEDGIGSLEGCNSVDDDPACTGFIGEWSTLNVDDGAAFGTPFKVTLLVYGSSVPGGTGTEDIVLIHVLDDGSIDVIGDSLDEICDSTTGVPTNAECITVTKVGGNFKIVAWLFANGSIRGGV